MDREKAVFILNPSSGKEQAETYREQCIRVLQGMGYSVEVRATEKEGDATAFAREAAQSGCLLVVAMGGDGTVNEAINGLAGEEDRPDFALIPLGTVNDFARALSIPMDPEEAIRRLPEYVARPTDIGQAGGHYFMNILAVGSLAEGVMDVPVGEKTRFGPLAYAAHGLQTLLSDEGNRFTITHDGGKWTGQASLVLAALTNSVGGFEKMNPDAATDDGLLHLTVIKNLKLPGLLKMSASLLLGKLQEQGEVEMIRTTRARIETDEPLTCNIDGDEGGTTPIGITVLHRHLRILAPEPTEGE
ncbi:Diacylglycerol kinase [Bhargavaea cecembensis DSE10]|uniref:Diacylglycerol kinase n=1 Tax=Bhargavaea cecembensis DSE10 TaxID=1235279 RepID=M7NCM3_9BACL|nr:diacylglycerol kinase family protein [Bhargavaea cecembensis]EMR05017.1 Diacylglycerol kinase [Bhargavaea cecembensis DSE10]